MLNVGDEAAEITFDWQRLQSMPAGKFKIHDVWRNADAGTTDQPFRMALDRHDVALLRLAPLRENR